MSKPKKLMVINGRRQLVPIDYQTRTETDKAYNQKRNRENKEYVSFYKTTAWRHTREQVLTRDYVTCNSRKPGINKMDLNYYLSPDDKRLSVLHKGWKLNE